MFINRVLISVLALAAVAIPASATTVYCSTGCSTNNETAFNNAVATAGLVFGSGFESVTPNGSDPSGLLNADGITGLNFFGYSGTTQDGVTVSSGVLDQNASGSGTSLQTQFPASLVYAFGAMVTVASGSATPCIEVVSSVSSFGNSNCNNNSTVVITGPTDTEFIGVVSSTPLSSVFIGTTAGVPGSLEITSFELGEQPAQTPEVATLLMIGSGLIGMRLLRRRANYKRAAAASSRNQAALPLRVANCAG